MNITKDKTVAAVVTENIKASHIFKKYNIDFCCGGGISIEKVCEKNGLDPEILMAELNNLVVITEDSNDYKSESPWPRKSRATTRCSSAHAGAR